MSVDPGLQARHNVRVGFNEHGCVLMPPALYSIANGGCMAVLGPCVRWTPRGAPSPSKRTDIYNIRAELSQSAYPCNAPLPVWLPRNYIYGLGGLTGGGFRVFPLVGVTKKLGLSRHPEIASCRCIMHFQEINRTFARTCFLLLAFPKINAGGRI